MRVLQLLENAEFFVSGPYDPSEDLDLVRDIEFIHLDTGRGTEQVPFYNVELEMYVFQLNDEGAAEEVTDDDDSVSAFSQWVLPAVEFQGVWENLVFDTTIKDNLLNYASTAMLFADAGVNTQGSFLFCYFELIH